MMLYQLQSFLVGCLHGNCQHTYIVVLVLFFGVCFLAASAAVLRNRRPVLVQADGSLYHVSAAAECTIRPSKAVAVDNADANETTAGVTVTVTAECEQHRGSATETSDQKVVCTDIVHTGPMKQREIIDLTGSDDECSVSGNEVETQEQSTPKVRTHTGRYDDDTVESSHQHGRQNLEPSPIFICESSEEEDTTETTDDKDEIVSERSDANNLLSTDSSRKKNRRVNKSLQLLTPVNKDKENTTVNQYPADKSPFVTKRKKMRKKVSYDDNELENEVFPRPLFDLSSPKSHDQRRTDKLGKYKRISLCNPMQDAKRHRQSPQPLLGKSVERGWNDVMDCYPWARFLSNGGIKRVYQVWSRYSEDYEAVAVM